MKARLAASALILALGALAMPAAVGAVASDFPVGYSGYHTYAEVEAFLDAVVAAHPDIAAKLALPPAGATSYEGRPIWVLKISDNVAADEDEPEVLFESLSHSREHLTVEQALRIISLLTDNYRADPATIGSPLEQRVSDIVNGREIWIVPMANPDGAEYDIADGFFRYWRKNRQAVSPSTEAGIDLNRNWGYRWGCCGGSNRRPGSLYYRGQHPWQAVETAALRDFVLSRVVNGRQQIRAAISWHSFNEEILWPYGYTRADLPRTMSADDLRTFQAMGREMAARNGYMPKQLSDLYVLDGSSIDWLYGDQRIFAFLVEMYPLDDSHVGGFYPPDSVIERETTRNDETVLYFLEQADCPYRAAGLAVSHCGALNDDFETDRGWTVNPFGTDAAAAGAWQRGMPQKARTAAGVKQLKYGFSGQAALVTGAARGRGASGNDVDGGVTSVLSPPITLGAPGGTGWTLDLRYAFGHDRWVTAADYLRISVDGQELFRQAGTGAERNAAWTSLALNLDAFAGRTVRLLLEVADADGDSLVEAAIDDVRVFQAP